LLLPNNTTAIGSETTKIKIKYNNNGVPGSKGYLDYINVVAKRKLQGYGKQFRFQYDLATSSTGIVQYNITNATEISEIWEISDLTSISKFENDKRYIFIQSRLRIFQKYIAVHPSDFYTPFKENRSNQKY
jgi:hypothetical protein